MAMRFILQIFALLIWNELARPGVLGNVLDQEKSTRHHEHKVIIDTDAGPDDAMNILILTSERARTEDRINVIAITCVDGNAEVDVVAENVLKTLKTGKRLDVPVYKGASHPLVRDSESDGFFGLDAFGDFIYPDPPNPEKYLKEEHAVLALIRLVRRYPGEITLVTTGPLTNIAMAIRLYPDFLNKLKRVVTMGGTVHGVGNTKPGLEFNFFFDPEAADVVLSSAVKPICLVPVETPEFSLHVSLEWRRDVLGRIDTPAIQLMNKAENIYKATSPDRVGDYLWAASDVCSGVLVLRRDASTLARTKTLCGGNPKYAQVVVDSALISGGVVVDYANSTMKAANIEIIEGIHTSIYQSVVLHYLGDK